MGIRKAEHRGPSLVLLTALFALFFNGTLRVGADRIFDKQYVQWIKGKRVGLITNPSGVDSKLNLTSDLLAQSAQTQLVALFAPEHGLHGAAQAGEEVASTTAFYSLYGSTRAPTAEMLKNVDVLIYDIQDVGTRFYTYLSTLFETMKAAAAKGIPLVVLDRPDPIDGRRLEGTVLQPGFESFVGTFPIPIRYGMTPGELAQLMNQEGALGCDVRVVRMKGWKRSRWYDKTKLEWVIPSPNMPTLTTATLYPGTCLVEGTTLSEGRGTTRPFEFIGAPWLDSDRLADRMNALGLKGVHFRPQGFTPTFSKFQGQVCRGIQIHVLDRNKSDPILVVLHLFVEVKKLHPEAFQINQEGFDRLAGTARIRERLLAGDQPEEIVKGWEAELKAFEKVRRRYLLY